MSRPSERLQWRQSSSSPSARAVGVLPHGIKLRISGTNSDGYVPASASAHAAAGSSDRKEKSTSKASIRGDPSSW
jgi:hypothetical protein